MLSYVEYYLMHGWVLTVMYCFHLSFYLVSLLIRSKQSMMIERDWFNLWLKQFTLDICTSVWDICLSRLDNMYGLNRFCPQYVLNILLFAWIEEYSDHKIFCWDKKFKLHDLMVAACHLMNCDPTFLFITTCFTFIYILTIL